MVKDVVARGASSIHFENREAGRLSQMLQGFPIDGRKVHTLSVSLRMQLENVRKGISNSDQPALVIHFYDSIRRPAGEVVLGPWQSDVDEWKYVSKTVRVPANVREAIVRIGLNGATGSFRVDDVQLSHK